MEEKTKQNKKRVIEVSKIENFGNLRRGTKEARKKKRRKGIKIYVRGTRKKPEAKKVVYFSEAFQRVHGRYIEYYKILLQ